MNVNFGSLIPIRCIFEIDKGIKKQRMISPDKAILTTLSKRINKDVSGYSDKLRLVDTDFRKDAFVATMRSPHQAFLLTGQTARPYRDLTSEYYRSLGEKEGAKPQQIINEKRFVRDKDNKQVNIDLFVMKQGNKLKLEEMRLVDNYGRPSLLYHYDSSGQLLLLPPYVQSK